MEHGSLSDLSASTFSLMDEDHTLANSVRFTLNQDPRVVFCGYSIPHPSDNKVNIRVQTTGDPAKEVLKDALENLTRMCQHVRSTFDNSKKKCRRASLGCDRL
ncbi:DNA-directed RNA polymerases I and III subunit RPAC2-like isoform X5 [Zingiber officinale]|uniref:DNA-directed RNA polymerases I and III subunit RPAC2-like isoform X5 n=1 Tax=Zingiber officinale TaxID=94328 RepID=UPI001C4CE653|nr:DNA-directed RNA polymerases I and III subunit RPAC2-like isoform X5 [Zingiber officinale]